MRIALHDICLSFPGKKRGQQIDVLKDVNLTVAPGEFVCIVGPSGCGKSTLLNIVGGFLRPTSGSAVVDGQTVYGPDPRRIFIFQESAVFPWLTVTENIGFGLGNRAPEDRQRIVTHYIEMVGLVGFEHSYPRELSGGMRQRVELARALAADPDVLYMDEPFGALDFLTRLRMRAELVRIWQRERKTVLFVTHDVEESVQLADRVVVMSPRPATIRNIVEIDLPRPRDLDSPDYLRLRDEIFASMGLDHTGLRADKSAPADPNGPVGSVAPHGPVATDAATKTTVPVPDLAALAPAAGGPARQVVENGQLDAQVIIIGGGPAGSTLGAYLAKAGIDHLILDKAVHPRRHVGESLVCSTTRLFEEIDFLSVMEREGFVRKYGANWVHWGDGGECTLRFREIPELGISQDYTYHVDRGRFDQLLLSHAEQRGSRVLQGAQVERIEFDASGRAVGVHVQHDGASRLLRCRMVADASGRNTILGSQLKLKKKDPQFNQFAVHGWYEGVQRGEADNADFIHVHLLPIPRGWAWQIPITDSITSIGVVTDGEGFVKSGEAVDDFFDRHVALNPVLAGRMAGARRMHDFAREGNYSYVMDKMAGDGWVLVGDAARFVDPIFSSGVSVAMESARRAADAIAAALKSGDLSARSFADYEETIRGGCDVWREFILLFYRLPQSFFNLLKQPEARLSALRLLQGEVYDRTSVPILERMRREIQTVAETAGHPLRPYLSPAPASSG